MRRFVPIALVLLVSATAQAEVAVLSIDGIGPARLEQIKRSEGLVAWAELGEHLLVEADAAAWSGLGDLVLERLPVEHLSDLAARTRVHCGPDADHEHGGKAAGWVFQDEGWQVLRRPFAKLAEDQPLHHGLVLAYQLGNRAIAKRSADPVIQDLVENISVTNWRQRLTALTAFDRLNESGFQAAATQVESVFAGLGLEVSRQSFSIPAGSSAPTSGRNFNVLGWQRGGGEGVVIVGAHLDARNKNWTEAFRSPGAEDNGSGCAGVMEAARVLRGTRFEADLLFICYGLEERGLFGSSGHAASLDPSQIRGMINMDMIAFDGDGRLDLSIETSAAGFELQELVVAQASLYSNAEVVVRQSTCCSDHVPYLARGIPAVMLIENDYSIYPQYHTSDDTVDRVSDAMALVSLQTAISSAAVLAKVDDRSRFSGYFYDWAQSGHGFHLEAQDNGQLFMAFYTFDAMGNRLWLIGGGTITGNTATLAVHETLGGAFPPNFNQAAITRPAWGTVTVEYQDCDYARIRWEPLPATMLQPGEMLARRGSWPAGSACVGN